MSKINNFPHFTITVATISMLGFDWLGFDWLGFDWVGGCKAQHFIDLAKNNNKSVLLTATNALLQCAIHTNPLYNTQ